MYYNSSTKLFRNKTHPIKLLSFLTALGGLFLFNALQAQNTSPGAGNFYAISGNGLRDTSWLFGTYHLVNSSYLEEVPPVQASFTKAKGVVVEIVIDSSQLAAVKAMGMLKNKTLSGLLDKPFSDSLDKELQTSIGVGISRLDQLKPMNVSLILSVVYLMRNNREKLDHYKGSSLDTHFAAEGKKAMKPITALETVEEQMNLLFNKTTDEEQASQLKLFIRYKNEVVPMGDEMLQCWFKHDLNGMYSVYKRSVAFSGERDDLVKNRNNKWMKQLPGLLSKESQFIAVGALHLAGPDGLVKQLEQLGYTVTPVKL
jgi:uncharacterized protein YbaP (TraB family)